MSQVKSKTKRSVKKETPDRYSSIATVIANGEELDNLNEKFGITDEMDILDIVGGVIGSSSDDW